MTDVRYNPRHKEILDSFLLEFAQVRPGKMFGYPAYYVGRKLFASLYLDGVCVKLPKSSVNELLDQEDYGSFEPMGKKMKEWILITHKNSEDYLKDKKIFSESIQYIISLMNE